MSQTYGLIASVIASFVTFLLGFSARGVVRHFKETRPITKVWPIPHSCAVSFVTADSPIVDHGEYTTTIYPAEFAAVAEMTHFLAQEFDCTDTQVFPSSKFPDERLQGELVVVGGPVNNRISRMIFSAVDVPFEFEGYELVDKISGKRYGADIRDGEVVRDVGLVGVFPNPFTDGRRLVLCAGCRVFGCLAAARALLPPVCYSLARHIDGPAFAFAVTASVSGQQVGHPKLILPVRTFKV